MKNMAVRQLSVYVPGNPSCRRWSLKKVGGVDYPGVLRKRYLHRPPSYRSQHATVNHGSYCYGCVALAQNKYLILHRL